MDTSVSLRATGQEAKEAVDEGFERLAVLDKLAGQNEDSDVSRINAAAGKDYVKVDPAIYEMIEYALKTTRRRARANGISPLGS